MGRKPCYNAKDGLNKGPWTEDEDLRLVQFIEAHGEGRWPALAKNAGLKRCGKSCRLRWVNYLRPNLKRGNISPDEEDLIIRLHKLLGNRWALIAGRIPGRTDNEIKNYWNTHLNKKAHGNQCIGQLKSVRATQTANVKEPAVSMTPSLNTFNQLGERDELVIASRVIEELKKGSTSSNSIVSGKEGKILISPTKQNPSSSSDAGTVSEEMKLWNPLQLNFILSSSWANSNFLHNDDSSVDKSVGYNEENAGHARPVQSSVDKAVSYNEENARPVQSCMFDAVNVCQDYFDQMFSIPHCSVPFPEVVPTTAATIDEFANFFNFFPYPY